jgi:RNA polymerase sigma-70 factor (ECF subfamily)
MSLLWPSYDDRLGELLARSQRGDRDAFRSLYLELYGPVSRFIRRRIGRPEDAEDLTARVFQKLLERLDDFDAGRGTVPMFVLAMARSTVIDHIRATRGSVPVEDLAGVLADETGTPLDALVREEELREVRAVLGELPPDVREMFALRFGDGLRHAQIAEILGLQVAAVKQRFSRALRDLKAKLREGAGRERKEARPPDALREGAADAEGSQEQSARSEGAVVDVRV